jgi:hypothetical protein
VLLNLKQLSQDWKRHLQSLTIGPLLKDMPLLQSLIERVWLVLRAITIDQRLRIVRS